MMECLVHDEKTILATGCLWIRTNTASFKALSECLMKAYREIQLQGGVCNSVRRGRREMDLRFYAVGCPHREIKCFIAQINKLLMHLGSKLLLG